jgi:hypothetical protein
MKRLILSIAALIMAFGPSLAVFGQARGEILIKNATVLTASHGTLTDTDILIRERTCLHPQMREL